MRTPRRPAHDLRTTIDCLPRHTRAAMLGGIDANTIIVGAYTDRSGGICPMLAAHRRGGRTSLASFAHAWDRYTKAGKRSRNATDRELLTLRSMLEASLGQDELVRGELAEAVAEFKAVKARRAAEAGRIEADRQAEPAATEAPEQPRTRRDTGERDRSEELAGRPGWAWLRVFRRYDDYEAALERLRRAEEEVDRRELERV